MASPIDDARAAGYSDSEINTYLAPRMADALSNGYSQDEINQHLGIKSPPAFDEAPVRAGINANLAGSAKPVTSFTDALEAGWQLSTAGLVARGKAPEKQVSSDAPMASRIAGQLATMAGDVPAMVAGFAIGGGAGVETGPGAVITGTAGAMALPTALRATLMDAYEKGQFTNFADFWARTAPIFIDTAKSWFTGAATGGAGVLAGKAAPLIAETLPASISPAVAASTKTAAEVATMTTVGAGLEGRVPSAQEFLDNAITLGGLKFAEAGAGKLRAIYAKTGIPPFAVVADAAHDLSIQQDLLSDKPMPDVYAEAIARDEAGRAAAMAEAAKPGEPTTAEAPAEDATNGAAAYAALPKEPKRLIQFLRESTTTGSDIHSEVIPGGIKDVGGDVAAAIGGPKGRPGLINNASGRELDAATQHAWQAGYFAEHDQRPEINDLLNAIREDHTGNPRYSIHDQDRVADYHNAIGQNAEIERIAAETGIDPKGRTREQFFNAVTDHLSADEAGQAQTAADQALADEYADFERNAKSITKGDWNPNEFYGSDQGRSLEDLENEHRQEDAAATAQQRARGDAQPGSAGRVANTGEAGSGQGGSLVGPAGRDATQASGNGGGNQPPDTPPAVAAPVGPPANLRDAQSRVLVHISTGEAAPARPWTFARLYSDAFNKLFPIEQAVTRTAGTDVLAAAEDAGKLARLLSGATGIADRFVKNNTLDFATRQPNGPGLEAVLAPMRDDMDGLRAYAAASRALELDARDIKTGFDLDAARMVAQQGAATYGAAFRALIDYQNRTAAYLRDSGVLSSAGYDAMRDANKLYVPFQRVIEQLTARGRGTGGGTQPGDPVHAMTGSERMVIDPIESIIRNTYLYMQMAEKNVTGTKLIDLLLAHGEAESADTPAPPRASMDQLRAAGVADPDVFEALVQASRPVMGAEVRIFRDGNAETYRVDPELARAVQGLDSQSMGDLERMLRPFANTLRAGAVLQPDFVARHTIRDFLYAVVTHPGFFSPLDLVRGFTSLAVKDADYQDWLSSGGAGVSMVSLDRRYLQHSIEQMTGTGLLERAWNVVGDPNAAVGAKLAAAATLPLDAARKFLLNPMQMAVEFAESATHIGTFIKAKNAMLADQPPGTPLTKAQIQEAGFASRDVAVDAARMGAKIRTLNALSAFSNIVLQDSDRVVRAFMKSPMSTAIKVAGAISLPSVLTWMNGQGDPRYDDSPAWQRDLFWVLPTDRWQDASASEYGARSDDPALRRTTEDGGYQVNNGITFRIPKPWGMGLIFGSGVERSLDSFVGSKSDAFKNIAASMADIAVPSLIPNAVTPMLEQYANRSIFTNRTLVPDQMEKMLPEYQCTPYTTETAKALGMMLGGFPGIDAAKTQPGMAGSVARALSSPILLENYLRAWTGNLGMYALQLADLGLRKAGVVPDPPNQPASTLADIPFVRAFVTRYPSSSAESIQTFNDSYDQNKVYFDTWEAKAKQGDPEAMLRIQAASPPVAQQGMTDLNASLLSIGKPALNLDPRMVSPLDSAMVRKAIPPGQQMDIAGAQSGAVIERVDNSTAPVSLGQLGAVRSMMTRFSQIIRDTYKNPDIPPDEKRQLIDTAYWRMTSLAQSANRTIARAAQTLGPLSVPASTLSH